MKKMISIATLALILSSAAFAKTVGEYPAQWGNSPDESFFETCDEASIATNGFIVSDCFRIASPSQDYCAAHSIALNGFVVADCFRLDEGALCAAESLSLNRFITSDCFRIHNERQDNCAAASLHKNGFVISDCFRLGEPY